MGLISGRNGNVKFSSTTGAIDYSGTTPVMTAPTETTINAVKNMSSWKIDTDIDLIEAPVFGMGGWKGSVAGQMSYSGNVSGYFDKSDTTGQEALRTAAKSGKPIYMEFYMDATSKYSGNVYVKKQSIDESASDLVKFDIDVQGDGALC